MTTYTTRDEAILRQIIDPICASGVIDREEAEKRFDIEAIAADTLGGYATGYAQMVDAEEFWQIVERHARPAAAAERSKAYLVSHLVPAALACIRRGLRVHVPPTQAPATFFWLTHPAMPQGAAIVSAGSHPSMGDRPVLTAPITPNTKSGSAVLVDYDPETGDDVNDALALAAAALITDGSVEERFVDGAQRLPLDVNRVPSGPFAVIVDHAEQIAQ